MIGAIEAGGTKFVCGIGNDQGEILDQTLFPTGTPEETLAQAVRFFRGKPMEAIGVGSFGPIDLDPGSSTYGYITTTPKENWRQFDFVGALRKQFQVPIGFDTDVNAAALGESVLGAAKGLGSCLYMTVGTGIGAGTVAEGKLIHGMQHPEMGHILVKRHPEDHFQGICPYHGDCLEGLASRPALEKRWGKRGYQLELTHKAWEIEAYYIAQTVVTFILILSPKKIIVGGGIMKQRHLFPLIREQVQFLLNGYVQQEEVIKAVENYIVPPALGDCSGLYGALMLGRQAKCGSEAG
ncbi:fructokinase [Gordoniibacillus kamchatkensis]|uniref:fructokinase n=1 Tax=Gordoniibacillus kamchatkensis TaxID=1590651 RepID=A0ABR5AHD2_9BACL|nr:ROK family protein [Paenibacillus sp. VKM B-2647]KIL40429.1 fructokinase [Paenibacillus sp. VKM B-2647]